MIIRTAKTIDAKERQTQKKDRFKSIFFNKIVSERLELTGDERRCIAWAQDGLGMGIGMDDELKVSERADKSYSTYVYRRMTIGAVRTEDEKVLEIRCQEPQATS